MGATLETGRLILRPPRMPPPFDSMEVDLWLQSREQWARRTNGPRP